jgi:hypothetical protein
MVIGTYGGSPAVDLLLLSAFSQRSAEVKNAASDALSPKANVHIFALLPHPSACSWLLFLG